MIIHLQRKPKYKEMNSEVIETAVIESAIKELRQFFLNDTDYILRCIDLNIEVNPNCITYYDLNKKILRRLKQYSVAA